MNHRNHQVLQLDIQGTPQAWITAEEAALHYATGTVACSGSGSAAPHWAMMARMALMAPHSVFAKTARKSPLRTLRT